MRDARYSLNLVVLALALRGKFASDALRLTTEDWQRLTLFWKSRLSSSEWASIVLRISVEPVGDGRFTVGQGGRLDEGHEDWLVMSEPLVTLDDVSATLRDAVWPLVSRYGLEMSIAFIELTATPVEHCLPALERLIDADGRGDVAMQVAFSRLGTGGDDMAILAALKDVPVATDEVDHLEVCLRLYEKGCRSDQLPGFVSLERLLTSFEMQRAVQQRPDLLKRARAAAVELGFEWPPSGWQPGQSTLPR
jgi:hypothetical protein